LKESLRKIKIYRRSATVQVPKNSKKFQRNRLLFKVIHVMTNFLPRITCTLTCSCTSIICTSLSCYSPVLSLLTPIYRNSLIYCSVSEFCCPVMWIQLSTKHNEILYIRNVLWWCMGIGENVLLTCVLYVCERLISCSWRFIPTEEM
jgi:hypothetical protein